MFSKAHFAPQKIAIPRLELLGVLIGIRALKFVEKDRQQDSLDRFTVCPIQDAINQASTGFCK